MSAAVNPQPPYQSINNAGQGSNQTVGTMSGGRAAAVFTPDYSDDSPPSCGGKCKYIIGICVVAAIVGVVVLTILGGKK